MSAIPPNPLGSIIQTQGAQQRAGTQAAREAGAQAERTGTDSFAANLQDVIETSDRDSQVYSDAEGAGSQGRPSEEQEEQAANPQAADETDPAASGGLDVEA